MYSDNDLPDIVMVLEHYGAVVRRTTGQVNIKCPFHDDSHASASFNTRENIFNCFACGMQGNSLQINDRGVATCSDGGSIALPKVTCNPQPNGQANCQGRYENGATFPVSMRHAPK
jgi:hypothetical protein